MFLLLKDKWISKTTTQVEFAGPTLSSPASRHSSDHQMVAPFEADDSASFAISNNYRSQIGLDVVAFVAGPVLVQCPTLARR